MIELFAFLGCIMIPIVCEVLSEDKHGFDITNRIGVPSDAMSPLSVAIVRDDRTVFREGEDVTDHFAGQLWKDPRVHLWGWHVIRGREMI